MYSLCLLNESSNIRKKGYVRSGPFLNAYKLVSLPLSKLHSSVKGRGVVGGVWGGCKGGPKRAKKARENVKISQKSSRI